MLLGGGSDDDYDDDTELGPRVLTLRLTAREGEVGLGPSGVRRVVTLKISDLKPAAALHCHVSLSGKEGKPVRLSFKPGPRVVRASIGVDGPAEKPVTVRVGVA